MPPAGRLISNPAAALGTGTIPGMAGWNENPGGMSVWRRALLTILLPTIDGSGKGFSGRGSRPPSAVTISCDAYAPDEMRTRVAATLPRSERHA